MELYEGNINEFVDWISGENSLTGNNDTGNLPVSGGSIRALLQDRLKNPVVIIRDRKAKLYRVFSSEASRRLWESNPSLYGDLELANFVAPSEYGVVFKIDGETNRYIREGVSGLNGSVLKFRWSVENDKGNEQQETLYLTLKLNETGESHPFTIEASRKVVSIDIADYFELVSGTNTILINGRGAVTGATVETLIVINTVTLNIRTDLNTERVLTLGNPLLFGLYATRNLTGPLLFLAKRYCYGANLFNSGALSEITSDIPISVVDTNDLNPSVQYSEINNPGLESGLHVVLIVAKMDILTLAFYSNMLYYLIGVNKSTGDIMSDDRITFKYEYNNDHNFISDTGFVLLLTQYESTSFDWSYIRLGTDNKTKTISWYLLKENSENSNDFTETYINEFEATSGQVAPKLTIFPSYASELGYDDYLIAKSGVNELIRIPIYINKSNLEIGETTGINLGLKLSAFSKSNNNSNKADWTYTSNNTTYRAVFSGVNWNEASGWYNNSLRLAGLGSTATINYNPFYNLDMVLKGVTVEIEFESEYVQSTNDVLIRAGGNSTYIEIKPNKATLYVNNAEFITTNYKANEKVKLAFIVNPSDIVSDELKQVAFIINNGICERAASWDGLEGSAFSQQTGNIVIGGSNSGVRVYNIRCYNTAITVLNAFNNYVFDSDNKANIYNKNDIYTNGLIDIEKCRSRIDIIKLTGDLSSVLARNVGKDESNSTCTIERICDNDPSKNFKVTNGRIRKHGQSTLTYPLTSYKLWFNSSATDGVIPSLTLGEENDAELPFTKNRYLIKDGAIPANKFVLQANYADSSGVHNGGLERLIQDTWYNAVFPDGEYKLRTSPLLFASNKSISRQVGDTTPQDSEADLIFRGFNASGKQWKDYFGNVECPYIIRNAPDSFPCLVFYRDTSENNSVDTLLGLYVFMDDKKSDFVYGERSIYYVKDSGTNANNANDPFCVKRDPTTGDAVWNEKNGTKIWDNKNVLRIEVLSVSSTLADYRGYITDNSKRRYDNFIAGNSEGTTSIGWEEDFELVYPDKEDITTSKQFDAQKFLTTVSPFTNWLGWLIGTKVDYALMGYQSAQSAFEATAASHLDLYKLAAYYIMVLRYGLVDSLERNAQIKTYDGVHFHYEPWDMDIALGNRNTGGIAFDPPIDRRTMLDETTAAISGYAKIDTNNDDIADTWVSNWLFDALEAWDYWMNTIVRETADALYDAGLTYADSIKYFDQDYQNAWCERIYNHSGNFKYVVNRQNTDGSGNITQGYNNTWLAWLQGARTTHRHWWLKTSMDYYDAKWGVGEFMKKRIYLACEMHNKAGSINIIPTSDTFFSFTREADMYGPFSALASGYSFSVADINSGAKVPFYINGANFIKELDISIIAEGLQTLQLDQAYSEEVGPIITKLNMGVKFLTETTSKLIGQRNGKSVNLIAGHALDAIEELNVRGQNGSINLSFLSNIRTIKKLYAAGAKIISLSTAVGTLYEILELPDTITSLTFNDTSWSRSNLSFWTTTPGGDHEVTYTYDEPQYDEETNTYFTEETVIEYLLSEYNKYTLPGVTYDALSVGTAIPRSLVSVTFTGNTGTQLCARQFLHDWMYSILDLCTDDWLNSNSDYYSAAHEYSTLDEYIEHTFNSKRLVIENILWDNLTIPGLSYQELTYLAMFNGIDYSSDFSSTGHPNVANFSRGYVVMTDNNLTGIQASLLATWFGEGVFTLNSDGLTIDNASEITTITVGPSAYVENGEIYLVEGQKARLSATRFRLQQNTGQLVFTFRDPSNTNESLGDTFMHGSSIYPSCRVSTMLSDGDYYYYLETTPSTEGDAYNIVIGSGNTTQLVHILPLDYPQDIQLGIEINDNMLTVKGGSSVNPKANSYDNGNISYYSSLNCYTVPAGSSLILGLQFKENDKYFYDLLGNDFKTPSGEINGYVKFRIYKNGTLLSTFSTDKDYYEFSDGATQTPNNADGSYLQYYTGYNRSRTAYKYFIPLAVNVNPETPIKYTVVAEVKMGGKISVISLDIIVSIRQILAEEGTLLWGIIDGGYYSVYGQHFEQRPFYLALSPYITGTIGNGGVYYSNGQTVNVSDQISTLTSLRYGAKSVLYHLPYITGINFDGASLLPSSITYNNENIFLIDLSNIIDLRTISIQNCTSLTANIDLSSFSNITLVDASGTSINVLVPANAPLTKYELGTPTSINLTNPTVLTSAGVNVDICENLGSLDLINIPNNKSFAMFDKIYVPMYSGGLTNWYDDLYYTDYISNSQGLTQMAISRIGNPDKLFTMHGYSNSSDTELDYWGYYPDSDDIRIVNTTGFLRIKYRISTDIPVGSGWKVTTVDGNTILFKWIKTS